MANLHFLIVSLWEADVNQSEFEPVIVLAQITSTTNQGLQHGTRRVLKCRLTNYIKGQSLRRTGHLPETANELESRSLIIVDLNLNYCL
jgi:hypothetical protein